MWRPCYILPLSLFSLSVCVSIYPSIQCYPRLFLHSVRVCTSLCWMLPAACAWKQHITASHWAVFSPSLSLLLLVVFVMMGGGRSNTHMFYSYNISCCCAECPTLTFSLFTKEQRETKKQKRMRISLRQWQFGRALLITWIGYIFSILLSDVTLDRIAILYSYIRMRQIGLQRVSPCNGYVIYSDCWNPFFHVNDNALVLYISTVEYAIRCAPAVGEMLQKKLPPVLQFRFCSLKHNADSRCYCQDFSSSHGFSPVISDGCHGFFV